MSKTQLKNNVLREIESLNNRIDLKILKGRPYAKEARRHKMLLSQLNYMERGASRSRSFFSLFV